MVSTFATDVNINNATVTVTIATVTATIATHRNIANANALPRAPRLALTVACATDVLYRSPSGVEGFALVRQTSVDRRREYFNEHVLNKISASGQHSMAAFLRHLMPTSPTSVRAMHDEEDMSALDERIGRLGEEMVEFPPGELP